MDISPLLHALCAVAAQILVGLFTGNWAYGAIAGCTFFIAREHTQAEYRWIEMFGHGKRMNMPWWGGFDRKRLARTVLIFTERSDQLSRATDRVPGLPANPGYAQ